MKPDELNYRIEKSKAKRKFYIKIETEKEVYSYDGVPIFIVAMLFARMKFNGEMIHSITIEPYVVDIK